MYDVVLFLCTHTYIYIRGPIYIYYTSKLVDMNAFCIQHEENDASNTMNDGFPKELLTRRKTGSLFFATKAVTILTCKYPHSLCMPSESGEGNSQRC